MFSTSNSTSIHETDSFMNLINIIRPFIDINLPETNSYIPETSRFVQGITDEQVKSLSEYILILRCTIAIKGTPTVDNILNSITDTDLISPSDEILELLLKDIPHGALYNTEDFRLNWTIGETIDLTKTIFKNMYTYESQPEIFRFIDKMTEIAETLRILETIFTNVNWVDVFTRLEDEDIDEIETIISNNIDTSGNETFGNPNLIFTYLRNAISAYSLPNTNISTITPTNTFDNSGNQFNIFSYRVDFGDIIDSDDDFFQDVVVRPTQEEISSATQEISFEDINKNGDTTEELVCPIDLCPITNDDDIIQIKHCKHIFKKDNIMIWFQNNTKCPNCRYDIREG